MFLQSVFLRFLNQVLFFNNRRKPVSKHSYNSFETFQIGFQNNTCFTVTVKSVIFKKESLKEGPRWTKSEILKKPRVMNVQRGKQRQQRKTLS